MKRDHVAPAEASRQKVILFKIENQATRFEQSARQMVHAIEQLKFQMADQDGVATLLRELWHLRETVQVLSRRPRKAPPIKMAEQLAPLNLDEIAQPEPIETMEAGKMLPNMVEPVVGWRDGLALMMAARCPWCAQPITHSSIITSTENPAVRLLNWNCAEGCNP